MFGEGECWKKLASNGDPGAALSVGTADQVRCAHRIKLVKALGGRHVYAHHVGPPENELGMVGRRQALSPKHHVETIRAPCEQASVVKSGPSFADLARSPHTENADAAALTPETVEALRCPHQRWVVGPHTSVDESVRLHPMRGKERRRRRSGQSHLHGWLSPVASKIWMVRGAEQMDVIRGQVVTWNGEPDPRIAKKPVPKAVLQHRS